MNLARMMTDKVFFENKNGTRQGPYKTRFGTDRITVFQDELNVAAGDRVVQPLSDGSEQAYMVEAVAHNAARRNIPGHFIISIAREAVASSMSGTPAASAGLDIGAATPGTCGGNIPALLQSLAGSIENASFPAEQKDEAKRLLRALIEHPVVAAVLKSRA